MTDGEQRVRPFLKWAGGKRSLIAQFHPHLPRNFRRYREPFVGSAALFFHLDAPRATLSDNNERLIRTYRGLRNDLEAVLARLRSYPHDREFFLELRQCDIDARSDADVAAWMIYLNKTGYNGLYRVNSKNRFNVPFGDYAKPNYRDEATLRACARRLRDVSLKVADFETAAGWARAGDFVYFDPPYVPLSATSSFTSYTAHGFCDQHQRRLRDVALRLRDRGVHVCLSNSSSDRVYELYADDAFELHPIAARRSINARSDRRGPIAELLIVARPT
ncbi:MAG: DNA adenine methylase [Myxococcota bacterium]